jgi:hypothetical protein
MSTDDDWQGAAFAKFGHLLAQAQSVLIAQGAMGWAYRGDLDQLRKALGKADVETLRQTSVAAGALASMADEALAGREVQP